MTTERTEELKPVTIPGELYAFLMGEGEIDGTSFGDLNAGLPGRFWWRALLRTAANTRSVTPQAGEGVVEAVAKAICKASAKTWRSGTYEVASGRNFEVEDRPLDPFNNHWRHIACAAIAALPPAGRVEEMREALSQIERQPHLSGETLAGIARTALNGSGQS